MNEYLHYDLTGIIEVYWIFITYLIYLLQVTTHCSRYIFKNLTFLLL